MSKRLMMSCKKVALYLLVGTGSLGMVTSVTSPLHAAVVSEKIAANEKVTIGDTTITFGNLKKLADIGEVAVEIVVERKGGFPKNAEVVYPQGKGSVTIDGKLFKFSLSGSEMEKVSETKAKGRFVLLLEDWEQGVEKTFNYNKLKGKKIDIEINDIVYEGAVTPISKEFVELLKNVPVVTDVIKPKRNKEIEGFLPVKDLNVPIVDIENRALVDNIGFVNGRLQVTMKREEDKEWCSIGFKNKTTGKELEWTPMTGSDDGRIVATFKIKDMAELANYTPFCKDLSAVATEKGNGKVSYTLK